MHTFSTHIHTAIVRVLHKVGTAVTMSSFSHATGLPALTQTRPLQLLRAAHVTCNHSDVGEHTKSP